MKWLIPMAVSLVFAGPTLAQDRKVEQAIKHRKAAFTLNHRTLKGGSYG